MRQGTRVLYQDGTQYSVAFDEPVLIVTRQGAEPQDDIRVIILQDDGGKRLGAKVEDFGTGHDGEPPLFIPI